MAYEERVGPLADAVSGRVWDPETVRQEVRDRAGRLEALDP